MYSKNLADHKSEGIKIFYTILRGVKGIHTAWILLTLSRHNTKFGELSIQSMYCSDISNLKN
jgi:hypothetical protein